MPMKDGFLSFGHKERRVPLPPMPSMAMLMIIKAKWWEREMEKIRVRVIS